MILVNTINILLAYSDLQDPGQNHGTLQVVRHPLPTGHVPTRPWYCPPTLYSR